MSEGNDVDVLKEKKITIELNGFEIKMLLEALGQHEHYALDNGLSTKATQNLITKIYRGMGVKL